MRILRDLFSLNFLSKNSISGFNKYAIPKAQKNGVNIERILEKKPVKIISILKTALIINAAMIIKGIQLKCNLNFLNKKFPPCYKKLLY